MAPTPKAAAVVADIDAPEPTWSVIDTNAKDATRTHRIAGVSYPFAPGQKVSMPEPHAAKFLRDPAFHVFNGDGQRVTSMRKPSAEDTKQGIKLAADEVIARLDELGQEALLLRARMFQGGEDFRKNAKREDLIAFLIDARDRDPSAPTSIGAAKLAGKTAATQQAAADDEDDDGEAMTDAELGAMLDTGANE